MRRAITVAAIASTAMLTGTTWASAATSTPTVNSSGAYGNPARYAPYWHSQNGIGDCVEQSARLAMDSIAHKGVVSPEHIDATAKRLGILASNGQGSNWDASIVTLYAHYGFKATAPRSTSIKTVEHDLSVGDAVQVGIYGGYIWDGMPDPGHPGYVMGDPAPVSFDHAVDVESINKTTGMVTLGDLATSVNETVPMAQFLKAWSVSGYSAVVVSR